MYRYSLAVLIRESVFLNEKDLKKQWFSREMKDIPKVQERIT